jgi:CRISPR-associated protein Cas1
VPIKLLERVVLRGAVGFDSGVLAALGEQGATVLCLSGRHSRRNGLLVGPGHADARRRVAQYRLQDDGARRLIWSRDLVASKLRGQRRVLAEALERRPDLRKPLSDGIGRLDRLLDDLAGAGNRDAVLGLEGAGAAGYFPAFATLFADSLGFRGRNRRPPRDPVNAALSLGYTLLHHEAVHACHAAGLDPLLGFFHELEYGRESLACDLVEPLRPRLDGWLWGQFRERALRADHFAQDGDACLMTKTGRQIFYPAYEEFALAPRRYLRRRAYSLARELLAGAPAGSCRPAPEDLP